MRTSWSTILEMKLICSTFLFSNSYYIICEGTVIGGKLMRSCGLYCEICGQLLSGLCEEGKEKVEKKVRAGGEEL